MRSTKVSFVPRKTSVLRLPFTPGERMIRTLTASAGFFQASRAMPFATSALTAVSLGAVASYWSAKATSPAVLPATSRQVPATRTPFPSGPA